MTVSPSCTAAAGLRGRQPTAGCARGRVGTPWGGPQHAESGLTTGEQGGLAAPSVGLQVGAPLRWRLLGRRALVVALGCF